MFTVKTEVRTQLGVTTFHLFECESVEVKKSMANGCNGPGMPAFVAPDFDVWLRDARGDCKQFLSIGNGLDHYCAMYVMNERGKTVESVYPGPAEPKLAA